MSHVNGRINIAFGVPAYRSQVHIGQVRMWLQLGAAIMADAGMYLSAFIDMDCCGVDKARNYLIAHAMKEGADWLLMVDSDTWCANGRVLLEMIRGADLVGASVVGAPVYRRVDGMMALNAYRFDGTKLVSAKLNGEGLEEVAAIGAAVMAVNLHKIAESTMFRFTDELSEDLDFCKQIHQLGGTIWCDSRVKTFHAKSDVMVYDPELAVVR